MARVLRLLAFMFVASAAAAQPNTSAKKIYDADTKKVRSGDLDFDWKEFRVAAAQGGTSYFDWHPARTKFYQEMDKGDTDAALKTANDAIDHDMAEPEGHLLALIAYQKLNDQPNASFQHAVVKAYLDSILNSGDGKSSKTAYFVVSVDEEYFFLNLVMGIGLPASQALVTADGHSFDKLTVKDKDGHEQEIWFNVDTSMNALSDALGHTKH